MAGGWRKSSFSNGNGGNNCVEVAPVFAGNTSEVVAVALQDSKEPGSSILVFTPEEWGAFLSGVKAGEFDGVNW